MQLRANSKSSTRPLHKFLYCIFLENLNKTNFIFVYLSIHVAWCRAIQVFSIQIFLTGYLKIYRLRNLDEKTAAASSFTDDDFFEAETETNFDEGRDT